MSWRSKSVAIGVCLAILAAGGFAYWNWPRRSDSNQSRRPAADTLARVSVAVVRRQDVPVYVTGLGTVQASSTIGIHSQVDGKLQELPFTEGQFVKKGDVLAKIDPRLFKAAVDQTRAKKAQDAASLI